MLWVNLVRPRNQANRHHRRSTFDSVLCFPHCTSPGTMPRKPNASVTNSTLPPSLFVLGNRPAVMCLSPLGFSLFNYHPTQVTRVSQTRAFYPHFIVRLFRQTHVSQTSLAEPGVVSLDLSLSPIIDILLMFYNSKRIPIRNLKISRMLLVSAQTDGRLTKSTRIL
jgi:hypothetical protein